MAERLYSLVTSLASGLWSVKCRMVKSILLEKTITTGTKHGADVYLHATFAFKNCASNLNNFLLGPLFFADQR